MEDVEEQTFIRLVDIDAANKSANVNGKAASGAGSIHDLVLRWDALDQSTKINVAKSDSGELTVDAAEELLRQKASKTGKAVDDSSTLSQILKAGRRLVDRPIPLLVNDVRRWPDQARALKAESQARRSKAVAAVAELEAVQVRRAVNLDGLREKGIYIQRKYGPRDDDKGAWLTFDRDINSHSEAFSAEFCFGWSNSGSPWVSQSGAVAAKLDFAVSGRFLANKSDRDNDLTAHGGIRYQIDFTDGADHYFINRHSVRLQGKLGVAYTRSQDGDRDEEALRADFVPVWGGAWMNVRRGMEMREWPSDLAEASYPVPDNFASAEWVLSSTLGVGRKSVSGAADAEFVHGMLTSGAKFYLDAFSRKVNGEAWDADKFPSIEATWTGFYLSESGDHFRHSWDVSLIVPIGHVWSIDASYHNGFDSSDFADTETLHIGLAILL